MLQSFLLRALNRLLQGEAWASDLLKVHAGKGAVLTVGGLSLRILVTEAGLLQSLTSDAEPAVRIDLPASALIKLRDGADQLTAHAHIIGDAGFAETIAQLLKYLRPDVGAALSPLLGDALAHRAETGLAKASASAQQITRNLSANIVEYLRDEQAWVVQQDELAGWRAEMGAAEEQLGRLEKRIALLSN